MGLEPRFVGRYKAYPKEWRHFATVYYEVAKSISKKILCMGLTGTVAKPGVETPRMRGVLPFVECMANDVNDLAAEWASRYPAEFAFFTGQERARPEISLYVYLNQDKENEIMRRTQELCKKESCSVAAPIFDCALVCDDLLGGDLAVNRDVTMQRVQPNVIDQIFKEYGVVLSVKDDVEIPDHLLPPTADRSLDVQFDTGNGDATEVSTPSRKRTRREPFTPTSPTALRLKATLGEVLGERGELMPPVIAASLDSVPHSCTVWAILSLYPKQGELLDFAVKRKQGPFSHKRTQHSMAISNYA